MINFDLTIVKNTSDNNISAFDFNKFLSELFYIKDFKKKILKIIFEKALRFKVAIFGTNINKR